MFDRHTRRTRTTGTFCGLRPYSPLTNTTSTRPIRARLNPDADSWPVSAIKGLPPISGD